MAERSYQEPWRLLTVLVPMKRENIADRVFGQAKKRYILNVWDSEGVRYEEPKLKIMVSRQCPQHLHPVGPWLKILKLIWVIEEDVIDFIDVSRRSSEIFSRGLYSHGYFWCAKHKNHATIYGKGCPIHVRGALLYNFHIKDKKLDNKYSLIMERRLSSFISRS